MLQNNSAARQIIVKALEWLYICPTVLQSSISLHFAQTSAKPLLLVGKVRFLN